MDYAEKCALATMLRTVSLVETNYAEEMLGYLERATVTERLIPTRAGDSRVLVVRPQTERAEAIHAPLPLFVNIHGGGFVRGYDRRDTMFCALIAERVGCLVIDIDYRLAPEFPFPTALHECYDVVVWALAHAATLNIDPKRLAIGGHSAGGNLTAAVCLMANRSKDFAPLLQILDYPFLDGVTDPADKLEPNSIFPVDRLRAFNALYARTPEDLASPYLSPVRATPDMLAGLPPALILTAGQDCLRFEAERYAVLLEGAGVAVTRRAFNDSDHGFVVHCKAEYRAAQDAMAAALTQAFAPPA